MIGSTNHLDQLDPAISKRPSRFDRKYHFKIPGETERRLYTDYWRSKLLKNKTVDFPEELCDVIAKLSEGFSFAYLKELFVMALLGLVRGHKGDDFEILESDEAASGPPLYTSHTPATEKEDVDKEEDKGDDKKVKKTGDVCTCEPTCEKCSKPLPQISKSSQSTKKEIEETEAEHEIQKNKMIMPTVEVPDNLKDNPLLIAIKHQITVLHADMDNENDEGPASAKMKFISETDLAARRMQAVPSRRSR